MFRLITGALAVLALSCALAQAQSRAALAERTIADTVAAAEQAAEPAAEPAPAPVAPAPPAAISLPVAAVTIAPGEAISAAMLEERSFPTAMASQHRVAVSPSQLVGKIARRTLLAGNVIPVAAVREAQPVTRGIATEIRFEKGGLSITTIGVPLESAAAGAMVRLKNADSGKFVSGVAQADGSVRISVP